MEYQLRLKEVQQTEQNGNGLLLANNVLGCLSGPGLSKYNKTARALVCEALLSAKAYAQVW